MKDYAELLFDELTSPHRPAAERWARVERLCAEHEPESLHLDFKAVAPETDPEKDDYVRDKIARALSGFANLAGGLLVFGIETNGGAKGEPDCAQRVERIANVGRFRAALERLASRIVEPPIAGVDIRHVDDPSIPGNGIVAVWVPASIGGPHRATGVKKETNDKYFMRTTTENIVMPHTTLEDRFSRAAKPSLQLVLLLNGGGVSFGLNVRLRNVGRGIATQPAICFRVEGQAGQVLAWYSVAGLSEHWRIQWARGIPAPRHVVYQSDPDVVIYPGLDVVVLNIGHGQLNSGASATLDVAGEIYCREARPVPFRGRVAHGTETVFPAMSVACPGAEL
ncbi:MAG TPA: ATP-binding protein [Polyangiaceae bacterium]